jgi:RNA polymerase sigma-70 factor (ECF subfamily)
MKGPATRPSLLVRLGDASQHEAWQEFVEIYEPVVCRLARQMGLQHADAQDLTQEVFVAVEKAIGRFDPESEQGSFRGWLFRIARNLTINFLTRQKGPRGSGDTGVQKLLTQHPASEKAATTLFEIEYQREVFRWAARRVRQDFREDTWRAFWLTGVEGQPIKQVAEVLGKTQGAVRIARCRVLARLREEVSGVEESEGV